jgi:hypothetical protein
MLPSKKTGAAEESRTLDLNLGKVALYQLSYCRIKQSAHYRRPTIDVNPHEQCNSTPIYQWLIDVRKTLRYSFWNKNRLNPVFLLVCSPAAKNAN